MRVYKAGGIRGRRRGVGGAEGGSALAGPDGEDKDEQPAQIAKAGDEAAGYHGSGGVRWGEEQEHELHCNPSEKPTEPEGPDWERTVLLVALGSDAQGKLIADEPGDDCLERDCDIGHDTILLSIK